MESSTYHAPNQERQPSGVGAGSKRRVRNRSLQEGLQTRESRLAELAESEIFVGLQPLKPRAER